MGYEGGGGGIDRSSESSGATDGGEAGESGKRAQIIDGEGQGVQHDHVEEGEVEADVSNTVPGHSQSSKKRAENVFKNFLDHHDPKSQLDIMLHVITALENKANTYKLRARLTD